MIRRKLLLGILLLLFLFANTSCDMMETLKGVIPKFDGKLPNVISGKFAYFEDETAKSYGTYSKLYSFNSSDNTFSIKLENEESGGSGSYLVKYSKFTITENNGIIYLFYEDGAVEILEFYYYATATNGPEYITLSDGTYYYWGK